MQRSCRTGFVAEFLARMTARAGGRLSVDNQPLFAGQDGHLTGLLNSLSAYDFDRIFAPGFASEPDLVALLQAARSRGLELTTRREPTEKVQQLRLKIDGLRRDLERMPWLAHELSYLIDHRNSLQRRIGQLEDDARRRRVHSDREYEELNGQIQDMEAEIAGLRSDWHTRDNDVAARRRELEEAWQAAEAAREEFPTNPSQSIGGAREQPRSGAIDAGRIPTAGRATRTGPAGPAVTKQRDIAERRHVVPRTNHRTSAGRYA